MGQNMGQTGFAALSLNLLPNISSQDQPTIKKNLLKSEDSKRFFGTSVLIGLLKKLVIPTVF